MTHQEARAAWVKLLRSGEFEQGKRALRAGDRRCCLGVACDAYQRHTGDGMWMRALDLDYGTSAHFVTRDGSRSTGSLPQPVVEWLGIQDRAGYVSKGLYKTNIQSLIAANDDFGLTFEEIADIIESPPEGLFVPEGGES